jgi:signal peptidase II
MQIIKDPKVLGWLVLSLALFVLDQWVKQLVVANMQYLESIEVMPFFNLFYVHNYGAAFSILSDQAGWQRWFLTIVTSLISIGLLVWLSRLNQQQKLLCFGLAMVLGGALGNLYDRVVFGYVIDYIDWYVNDYHWPAFNIADAAISIGAVALIIDSFKNPNGEKRD